MSLLNNLGMSITLKHTTTEEWRENVEYMLNDPKFAPYVVRVCEGGGEEDLIMSLVVTFNKMFNALPKSMPPKCDNWTGWDH